MEALDALNRYLLIKLQHAIPLLPSSVKGFGKGQMHRYGLIGTWKTAKGLQTTSSFLKKFPNSEGFEVFLVEKQVPTPACFPWATDLLTAQEYHCLLQLLCPDFPMELTQKAARIVLMDDAMDCLMSFSDFLFAFQIQFYYSEFLESVAVIYQDLLSGKNPNTVIVPTSSSGQHRQRQPPNDCSPLDGVDASVFYQCLESLCDRSKYSCPPSALVKEMLSSAQRLTFYGFLMALAKDQGINRALGALPDKGDLFVDPEMDQELEKLVAQVSGLSISGPTSSSGDTANLPVRNSPRINSPWKPLHHWRKMDAESEGSNEETDSSEN
ncbi:centriolar satellite-associated tubulin polyglutamylase complex regulator 1 isoform X5 [Columba livia]